MCGEMAGRTIYTPILLGMGIDQFSTNAFAISHVKEMARKIDLTHCQEVVKQLHLMKTADEIQGFMFEEFKRNADFEIEIS
jgi:phosphotransferase system enzyme I (PtsI)